MWLADSKPTAQTTRHEVPYGISSQFSLTPIGARFCAGQAARHLASGRVPRRSRKRSKIEAGSGPVTQPTTQVPPTVEFVRSGASSFSGEDAGRTRQHGCRDEHGELPTRICVGVAVEVACLSG